MKNVKNVLLVLVSLTVLSFLASRYFVSVNDSTSVLCKAIQNWVLYIGVLPLITFIILKDKK
jgi:pheromone shutdown protein TraB